MPSRRNLLRTLVLSGFGVGAVPLLLPPDLMAPKPVFDSPEDYSWWKPLRADYLTHGVQLNPQWLELALPVTGKPLTKEELSKTLDWLQTELRATHSLVEFERVASYRAWELNVLRLYKQPDNADFEIGVQVLLPDKLMRSGITLAHLQLIPKLIGDAFYRREREDKLLWSASKRIGYQSSPPETRLKRDLGILP